MAGRIDLVEEERRRNAQAVAPQATSGASVPAQVPVSQPVAQPQPQVQSPAPVPGTVGFNPRTHTGCDSVQSYIL